MNSTVKTILIAGPVIFFMWIVFYIGVVSPQKERDHELRVTQLEILAERQAVAEKERKYNVCTADAYASYSGDWDGQCEIIGRAADCTLPGYSAEKVNEAYKERMDRCTTMYK